MHQSIKTLPPTINQLNGRSRPIRVLLGGNHRPCSVVLGGREESAETLRVQLPERRGFVRGWLPGRGAAGTPGLSGGRSRGEARRSRGAVQVQAQSLFNLAPGQPGAGRTQAHGAV